MKRLIWLLPLALLLGLAGCRASSGRAVLQPLPISKQTSPRCCGWNGISEMDKANLMI